MNFSYLEAFPKFKKLYEYSAEAEEFAITKPNISATSARKAMEFPLGQLISDFHQTKAEKIHYKELADGVRHFKETEGFRMSSGHPL